VSSPRVLIFAAETDGGAAALALLNRCREAPLREHWWLTLLDDARLRVEHALLLTRSDLVIFLVDAPDLEEAYAFHAINQEEGHRISSSGGPLTPEDVLHTLSTLGRRDDALPRCYTLALRSRDTKALSADGAAELDDAFAFLLELLDAPEAEHWNQQLTTLA
jgi:hypothetical protein